MAPSGGLAQFDPDHGDADKLRRERQYHTVTVPRLRAFGFVMVAALAAFQHLSVDPAGGRFRIAPLVAVLVAYNAISWVALVRLYDRVRAVNLGDFFLAVDLLPFILVIYLTGGNASWMFILLFIRVADQTNTTFRRALVFGHLAVGAYTALLVYLQFGEHRTIAWPVETFKLLLLYFGNLYIAMTARTAERLRARLVDTIRIARESVAKLRNSRPSSNRRGARPKTRAA